MLIFNILDLFHNFLRQIYNIFPGQRKNLRDLLFRHKF